MLLTPIILDDQCSSNENSPLQPTASPLNKLENNHETHITDKKVPNEANKKYHHIRGARSSCGKILLKLYPSFYEEREEDRIIPYNPLTQQKERHIRTLSTTSPTKIISPIPQEHIQQIHKTVLQLINNRKYKQAIIKLFECERIASNKNITVSLRTYTKYLIVLIYFKIDKYEKCANAAEKSIKSYKEFNVVAEQYVLHIKYLWGKSMYKVQKYELAVSLLSELVQQYGRIFEGSRFNNLIFNLDHLLSVKADIAECYIVSLFRKLIGFE